MVEFKKKGESEVMMIIKDVFLSTAYCAALRKCTETLNKYGLDIHLTPIEASKYGASIVDASDDKDVAFLSREDLFDYCDNIDELIKRFRPPLCRGAVPAPR